MALRGREYVFNQQSENMSLMCGHFGCSSVFLTTLLVDFRVKSQVRREDMSLG